MKKTTMKTNRNSKIKKNKSSFWDSLPQINNKEKRQEIEELGYNPSEQRAVGKERITDKKC
ncbi:hypothetical protein ACXVQ9_02535 [Lactobacillus crispatus]